MSEIDYRLLKIYRFLLKDACSAKCRKHLESYIITILMEPFKTHVGSYRLDPITPKAKKEVAKWRRRKK